MSISVRGTNIKVTSALRDYAEEKIGKLERYFGQPLEGRVNLTVFRDEQHQVEVTLTVNGLILRAEERAEDMYAAIDLVSEKLERQFRKYKTRQMRGRSKSKSSESPRANDTVEEMVGGMVVKRKTFPIKPMTEEEAILQMELLSHDFFVFHNAETGRFNVLYKRHDGNYGLLEPSV